MKMNTSLLLSATAFIALSAFITPKVISKKKAASDETTAITQFQKNLQEIKSFATQYPGEKTHAYYFDASVFKNLLTEKNADGIRMYHAINTQTGERDIIMVAIDKNGDDILPNEEKSKTEKAAFGGGAPCPATCSIVNDAFSIALYGPAGGSGNKKAGAAITYKAAIEAVNTYRSKFPNEDYHAFAFSKTEIINLLSHNADGIRNYHAVSSTTAKRIIILARAGEGASNKTNLSSDYGGLPPCPTFCSRTGKLG